MSFATLRRALDGRWISKITARNAKSMTRTTNSSRRSVVFSLVQKKLAAFGRWGAFFASLCGDVWAAPAPEKSAEVCQVLDNLPKQGSIPILIRGRLQVNKYHGHTFIADVRRGFNCPLPRGDVRPWEAAINVKLSEALNRPDKSSARGDDALKAIEDSMKDRTIDVGFDVVVTVHGRLSVKDGVIFRKSPSGRIRGNAYGLDGSFPAELTVERVLKIEGQISRSSRVRRSP